MPAQRAIAFTHAAWSSPNSLTTGWVKVTAMMRPTGAIAIRNTDSRSRSCEERVIIVDSVP